jgi:dienelactone hydrolase
MSAIPGFVEGNYSDGEFSFQVFRKGQGPGVLLMHELPGLTLETVEFAEYIAAGGFHVAMPLLFGVPLQKHPLGLLTGTVAMSAKLCIRREFSCLAAGRSSPIAGALRRFCAKLHAERGGKGVGAIGMCFTGGFVLSMMLEPAVLAPVIAQPSLPFFRPGALDVEPETLAAAVGRATEAPLLGLRFELDWISKKQRMERLAAAFGGKPRFECIEVPGRGHATLTYDHAEARARGVDTRQRVLDHLRRQLA